MEKSFLNPDHDMMSSLQDDYRKFNAKSVLDITKYINPGVISDVRQEVDRLTSRHAIRRDLEVRTTGNTPRKMNNVDFDAIAKHSPMLMQLYSNPALIKLLANIAGEDFHECPYDFEKMVITSLQKRGDSHGWHWDDYSFAMIWVLRAPEKEKGGVVQCVPNTHWNRDNPSIISQFVAQSIDTYYFPEGSIYLMRSNTTLHRVYPLVDPSAERTILNNTYASTLDLNKEIDHSSMEELFAKPVDINPAHQLA
ncbi:MAG: hypothetical protein ABJ327_25465 [Litoreibacter sp.]